MDTMRGQFSGSDATFEDQNEEMDATRESDTAEVGRDERRMQVRTYNFWASLLGERAFPHTDDLHPEELDDFGPHSVLLDFAEGIDNPLVRYVGSALAEECDVQGDALRRLSDVPSRSLLSRITDHYMQILANQAPIGFEAEFVNQRGDTTLYRGILLPFSRDDAAIDAIYGVINWKTLGEAQASARREAPAAPHVPAMLREAAPMTEWADGPADADFSFPGEFLPALELPVAQFGLESTAAMAIPSEPDAAAAPASEAPRALAAWLDAAREEARRAEGCETRSRKALYAAIAHAYDFALAVGEDPAGYAALLAEAGLVAQDRAPLIPLVKLVFGANYDKTRLTEIATAIAHGRRREVARGAFADVLAQTPGGLKALVQAERAERRAAAGDTHALRARHEDLLEALRRMPPRPLEQAGESGEFTVLVARRTPDGQLVLLGEVGDDARLLDRAARHLLED